jgi:zinc protease
VPGTVVDRREDPDLGILSVTLANGVRAHLRTMDYRKNQVFVRLNLAGGRIRESETDAGITAAAATALTQPASESLSSVDIRDWMTGKGTELEAAVQEDAIHFQLSGSSGEIEEGFQLLHLLLTQAKVEQPALDRWQAQMEEYSRGRHFNVEARLAQESLQLITGGDHRFRLITHEEALAVTIHRARQWLQNMIHSAPIEMAVVGDVERDRALRMVLQFMGSLEERPVDDPSLDGLRRLGIEDGPFLSKLEIEMVAQRAAILSGWRVAPWSPARERQLMQMAEQVLMRRLQEELREKRGLTYGADCSFNPSRAYPEASLLTVTFYAPPERADEAVGVTRDLVETLAAEGPTAAEMEAIGKQTDDLVTRAQVDPRYWCRVLSDLHYHGTRLDDLKNLRQRVLSFSGRDMQAVLETYITEKRRFEVVCRCQEKRS